MTVGRVEVGATLAPSMEQGSLRRQHSPSPNSGQGAGSVSRVPPPAPQPQGHLSPLPPLLQGTGHLPPWTGDASGLEEHYQSSGPPGRVSWGR